MEEFSGPNRSSKFTVANESRRRFFDELILLLEIFKKMERFGLKLENGTKNGFIEIQADNAQCFLQ